MALPTKTGAEIIEKFQDLVDDEFAEERAYEVLNEVYHDVCNDRPWSFLLKLFTTSWASGASSIDLPDDFGYIPMDPKRGKPIVYVGTEAAVYDLVPMADIRLYRNTKYVFYIDYAAGKLKSTAPFDVTKDVSFDYIHIPEDIEEDTSPIWWPDFHEMLAYLMVPVFSMSDQEDKGRAYSKEAAERGQAKLRAMQARDVRVKMSL